MPLFTRWSALFVLLALLAAPASAQDAFFASLSGDNEVPAVETDATGMVRVVVNGTEVSVEGRFSGLESDYATNIGAHIHRGGPNENGPVVVALAPSLTNDLRNGRFTMDANTFTVSQAVADSISSGLAYINIHSVDTPSGELRGQITTSTAEVYVASLSGANEVPPVETDATGRVRVILDGTTIQVNGEFSGLESDFNTNIGAHIHIGGPDENGPVAVALVPTLSEDLRSGRFRKRDNQFEASMDLVIAIRTGNAYVNVHSVDNPPGEIRGQIVSATRVLAPGAAFAQIIHNAPDPGAAVVDVYVNGALAVDDFAFRTATPFVPLPTGEDFEVAIQPGTSTSADDPLFAQTFNLPEGARVQLIAQGVLDPSAFSDNPDDVSTAFELVVGAMPRLQAPNAGRVSLRAVHGAPDAPTVDLIANDRTYVDDLTYGEVTGYLAAANEPVMVTVALADGTPVVSYDADLSDLGGGSVTVLASGFLTPDDDQGGPAFGLLAVATDGSAFLLPVAADGATTAESPAPITEELPQEAILTAPVLALEALYPNPSEGNATVAFSLAREGAVRVAVYDALGREVVVAAEGTHQAGRHTASVLDLAAGVYVVRMEADGETFTQRLTVVR